MLAEARWRSGDAEGAASAARAHLEAGGNDPVALCIAAEAAAADGRPGEARSLMDRLGPPDAATLDALFAGMPRRAFWPSAPGESELGEAETLFGEIGHFAPRESAGRVSPPPPPTGPRARESSVPGPRDVLVAASGFWGGTADASEAPGGASASGPTASARPESAAPARSASQRGRHVTPSLEQDPVAELATARAELANEPDRALLRLGLTLRLDPTLAPAVLDIVAMRSEPAAALLRGDAQRLLGRHLEAEAAFAEAAARLGRSASTPVETAKPRS